ncbi:MAG: iron-containing alcohol dehydrogenase, partial [Candidatus Thermoplasmatota archaeon]|nr:iron-containing alcohol dehydrogenase [Candidatus Thermoplasmatota archaeon]
LIGYGKITDWATHMIEHSVSALYDVTHGIGLAILTPFWMEYVLDEKTVPKFAEYAKNIWNLNGTDNMKLARESIEKTKEFFKSLGMPKTLKEVGVKEDMLEEMAKKTVMFGPVGNFKKLGKKDVLKILTNAY